MSGSSDVADNRLLIEVGDFTIEARTSVYIEDLDLAPVEAFDLLLEPIKVRPGNLPPGRFERTDRFEHLERSWIAVTIDRCTHLFASDVDALVSRLETSGIEVSRPRDRSRGIELGGR